MSTRFFDRFRHDEDGAVTVDWVVLTAGIVTLGAIVVAGIIEGSTGMSGSVGAGLGSAVVPNVEYE